MLCGLGARHDMVMTGDFRDLGKGGCNTPILHLKDE
jgi:hypothetical protein